MARIHGKKGLIYLSGSELAEASAVTINETTDSAEGAQFNDSFVERAVGVFHWGGSISAWAIATQKKLFDGAACGFAIQLLAYPDRDDTADFYSGSIILSFEHSQDVASLAAQTASFEGNGTLSCTGFA